MPIGILIGAFLAFVGYVIIVVMGAVFGGPIGVVVVTYAYWKIVFEPLYEKFVGPVKKTGWEE